tara:strand:- start:594 stop:704 length:111 start_codon:yes stop_codon:yes gene_type:complete
VPFIFVIRRGAAKMWDKKKGIRDKIKFKMEVRYERL